MRVCNPSPEELEQNFEFELKLVYIVKCCLKKRQAGRQTDRKTDTKIVS